MKPKSILVLLLIITGITALVYGGISWTTREKAVDLGPIQVTAEKSHTLPLSPVIGGIALGCAAVLLFSGRKTA